MDGGADGGNALGAWVQNASDVVTKKLRNVNKCVRPMALHRVFSCRFIALHVAALLRLRECHDADCRPFRSLTKIQGLEKIKDDGGTLDELQEATLDTKAVKLAIQDALNDVQAKQNEFFQVSACRNHDHG